MSVFCGHVLSSIILTDSISSNKIFVAISLVLIILYGCLVFPQKNNSYILYSGNYIVDIEEPSNTAPLFHSFLLSLHFAIKLSEAEVLTELLIIKSVPVHSQTDTKSSIV